jgi:hypothetical protein
LHCPEGKAPRASRNALSWSIFRIDVLEACVRETLSQQDTAQRMTDAMRAFKEREQHPTRLLKN